MAIPVFQQAQVASREATVAEAAGVLQEALTPRLVAYIVGAQSSREVVAWAEGTVEDIPDRADKRLRIAFEIAQLLLTVDSPRVVRAWFSGMNPQLNDVSPARAIREGRMDETLHAARAFIVGG